MRIPAIYILEDGSWKKTLLTPEVGLGLFGKEILGSQKPRAYQEVEGVQALGQHIPLTPYSPFPLGRAQSKRARMELSSAYSPWQGSLWPYFQEVLDVRKYTLYTDWFKLIGSINLGERSMWQYPPKSNPAVPLLVMNHLELFAEVPNGVCIIMFTKTIQNQKATNINT